MRFFIFAVVFALFFLVVFSTRGTSALEITDYNITFEIMPDTEVMETISMLFTGPLNASSLNYVVLGDISDLSVSDGLADIDYTLEKSGVEYSVRFTVPQGTERLFIKFIAKDLVFSSESVYSFSTELRPPAAQKVTVMAFLPVGFALYRNVVYPEAQAILSDGERIYAKWDLTGRSDALVSLKFYNTNSDYSLLMMAVMVFAFVMIVAYLVGHYRKKMKCEFERGFSEDERKVLFILSKERRVMQKKIEKELGFSRAKMTRIVLKLEKKGLVEKERIGRTNRLFYKK